MTTENLPLRVLIADDHTVFLESLSLLVGKIPGYVVSGKMNNGLEVLSFLEHSPADMVLTDIQMPGMGGLDLIVELRRRFPLIKVLMLTMLEDAETIKAAVKEGVSGYIFKSASLGDFERALNAAAAGSAYYSGEVMRRMVESKEDTTERMTPETERMRPGTERMTPGKMTGNNDGLSERELEVIRWIAKGLTSGEIAQRLYISVNTVQTHRKNIFQKTGVKNAAALIDYSRRNGII